MRCCCTQSVMPPRALGMCTALTYMLVKLPRSMLMFNLAYYLETQGVSAHASTVSA